jgi:hypothetical protein
MGNGWPFPELSIVWEKWFPDTPEMPTEPIAITWKGEMVVSRERIRRRGLEVWTDVRDVLVSEVGAPNHVGGFSWNDDEG